MAVASTAVIIVAARRHCCNYHRRRYGCGYRNLLSVLIAGFCCLCACDAFFVLSPLSKTLCSYPYDGGAMNYAWGCGPTMCSEPSNIWGCAFPPSMLYRMMQIHFNGDQWKYNEVVVDQFNMSITAVWGGWGARQVHAKLLEHFGLNENQLPFLEGGKHPFG